MPNSNNCLKWSGRLFPVLRQDKTNVQSFNIENDMNV